MSDGNNGYGSSQNPSSSYNASTGGAGNYLQSQQPTGSYSDPTADSYAPYSSPSPVSDSAATPAKSLIFGNGVSIQPAYQENGDVDLGWELLQRTTSIKTIRMEIEALAVDAAVRWIAEATARKYDVIATFHSVAALQSYESGHFNPADDPKWMQRAIDFWNGNYAKLRKAGPFIINVMNEWGHKQISAKTYAEQYNLVISALRSYYSGPLIIDLPGAGQLAGVAADAVTGAGGITPIQDSNVILSMHVYPEAWNGKGPVTLDDVDLLAASGRPGMIGEFGESGKTPATDWRAIVTYAKSLSWPVLAWAWDGDGGIMNIMQPEFQRFVPGKPNTNYYINGDYANIVLPFLS